MSRFPQPMQADDLAQMRRGYTFYVVDHDDGTVLEAVVSGIDGDTVVLHNMQMFPVGQFSLKTAIAQRRIYADDPSPYYWTRDDARRAVEID